MGLRQQPAWLKRAAIHDNIGFDCPLLGRGERFRVEWLRDHFHLADSLQAPAAPVPQQEPLPARRARARATVEACGGNLAAAARDLRVTRKTLYSWSKREGKQS